MALLMKHRAVAGFVLVVALAGSACAASRSGSSVVHDAAVGGGASRDAGRASAQRDGSLVELGNPDAARDAQATGLAHDAALVDATQPAADGGTKGWWKPMPHTSWQWQLSGALDSSFDVQVYDIDLFETSAAQVATLHASGRKVVCYFDTAYEPNRPDSAMLDAYKGNPVQGWPGQYWLDVRQPAVLHVMQARIALARDKHCDGVEADDVDSVSNQPGFPTSVAQQRAFIRSLAAATHAAGLAYGLKNDLDDIAALLDVSDFAVNEECFQYNECDALAPFIAQHKAVFQVEYSDGDLATKGASLCPQANALDFDTLIKHLDLGPPRYACR